MRLLEEGPERDEFLDLMAGLGASLFPVPIAEARQAIREASDHFRATLGIEGEPMLLLAAVTSRSGSGILKLRPDHPGYLTDAQRKALEIVGRQLQRRRAG